MRWREKVEKAFYKKMGERYILKRLLPQLLIHKSPKSISRTGEEGESVNCFTIYLGRKGKKPSYLVEEFDPDKKELIVLSLDQSGCYAVPKTISFDDMLKYSIRVNHYYGLFDLYYTNVYSLAFNRMLRYDEFRVKFSIWWNKITQSRFNKKTLISQDSVKLLSFMLNKQLQEAASSPYSLKIEAQQGIGVFSLMTDLYTERWVAHPDSDKERIRLELHLGSLVESGDLKQQRSGRYIVAGKALKTLESFEKDERRHRDATKLQWTLVILTGLVALGTLQQAKVIEIRVWWDCLKRIFT